MVDGVTGVAAVNLVVEDGRKELVQIQHLHMEENIVQKIVDLEQVVNPHKLATILNALVNTKQVGIGCH